jgi:hypothetical protein
VWALIFTAAFSRHTFVWPTFSQSLADIIVGFEAHPLALATRG